MYATVKKYLAITRTGFEEGVEHRFDFFLSLAGWSVRLLISAFLFLAVFKTQPSIAGYNFSDTMLYFLVIQAIITFTFVRVEFNICNDIQNGDFSNYLIKPVSYLSYQIASELGKNTVRSIIAVFISGIIIGLYRPDFYMHFPIQNLPIMILSIFLAFFVSTFLTTIIALLAFWIVSAHRIIYMFFAVHSIFSGMLIPIAFFPDNIQNILMYTPFPYILYYPAQMMLRPDQPQNNPQIIMAQILIIAIELLVIKAMFYFGMKKYEATGR